MTRAAGRGFFSWLLRTGPPPTRNRLYVPPAATLARRIRRTFPPTTHTSRQKSVGTVFQTVPMGSDGLRAPASECRASTEKWVSQREPSHFYLMTPVPPTLLAGRSFFPSKKWFFLPSFISLFREPAFPWRFRFCVTEADAETVLRRGFGLECCGGLAV